MNILAFNGSPRRKGNTSILLHELLRGARDAGAHAEEVIAKDANVHYCKGCLRCNLLKRCAIKVDGWPALSEKILKADTLIFASPVYFHHLSAPLKIILDRFRSFIHVETTVHGLQYTPWQQWQKTFVLLLSLGSPVDNDAMPVKELFTFMTSILGDQNRLHTIIATGLVVPRQILMTTDELKVLYDKLRLPLSVAEQDVKQNQTWIEQSYSLGKMLGANADKTIAGQP